MTTLDYYEPGRYTYMLDKYRVLYPNFPHFPDGPDSMIIYELRYTDDIDYIKKALDSLGVYNILGQDHNSVEIKPHDINCVNGEVVKSSLCKHCIRRAKFNGSTYGCINDPE